MNDRDALTIFVTLVVGSDYIWEPPEDYRDEDETMVMRVRSKSLQQGENPGVRIEPLWFFVSTAKDGTTTFTEGDPAGSDSDGWQQLYSYPQPWTGERPTRTPLHAHYKCHSCEVSFEFDPDPCPHCFEKVFINKRCGGKHDDLCLCEDCTSEKGARNEG